MLTGSQSGASLPKGCVHNLHIGPASAYRVKGGKYRKMEARIVDMETSEKELPKCLIGKALRRVLVEEEEAKREKAR